jgi:hypothetical protein
MSKSIFHVPHKRDVGGVSSFVLLVIALILCVEWALLLHLSF